MKIKKFLENIKKNPKRQKALKDLSTSKAGLTRYLSYLDSPWKIFYTNFFAGVAYGIGFLVGAAAIIGLMGIIVNQYLSQIPIIGQSIEVFYNWIQDQVAIYQAQK